MTTSCVCSCHNYPTILMHDVACCENSTQWRCSRVGCLTPFDNVLQYVCTDPLGPAKALCDIHRDGVRVGEHVKVTSMSKGEWPASKITIRVTGGSYRDLLIESDCPNCGKPSATDHGHGDMPEDFVASFMCETCDIEWGCDVRLDVTKRD